jgi:hypothetical protein
MFRDETERVETDSLAACRIAVLTLGEGQQSARNRDEKAGKMAGGQSKYAPPVRTAAIFFHFSAFCST